MRECEWDLAFAENQDHWFLFADNVVKPVYLQELSLFDLFKLCTLFVEYFYQCY